MAQAAGATLLRGGAYKPRTSPYAFQGLGEEALRVLADVREAIGMPVVTEIVDAHDVELVAKYADMLQIGTRNMQNFALLQAVGAIDKPVMLKRGMNATIEEWLMAAEYIAQRGNLDIVLVRARHPNLRDGHPQHPRYQRRPRGAAAVPSPRDRRSLTFGRPPRSGGSARARGYRRGS